MTRQLTLRLFGDVQDRAHTHWLCHHARLGVIAIAFDEEGAAIGLATGLPDDFDAADLPRLDYAADQRLPKRVQTWLLEHQLELIEEHP